jgi:hypothetical protein
MGAAAMALGARLDDPDTAAHAMAGLSRELRFALDALTKGTVAVGDPVDELRDRREKRRAGG